jgi:hypothetical protein
MPAPGESLDDRPEVRNLIAIYAALSDQTRDEVTARFAGQGFGAFKPALADLAVSSLAPVTAEMRRLMDDPAEIDRVLKDGAERAMLAEMTIATAPTNAHTMYVIAMLDHVVIHDVKSGDIQVRI